MAAWLIRSKFFDQDGTPGDSIDGAELGLALDNVVEAATSQHDAMTASQEAESASLWEEF
jgi:hypothetical protein